MGFGSDFKNAARTALDVLSGGGEADRLKFSRYAGSDITAAIMTSQDITNVKPREVVILEVNPAEISYSKVKLITKVPTSAPERFIVQDWGSDLTIMGISGNTGNLLPAAVQSGVNPFGPIDALVSKIKPGEKSILGSGQALSTASALSNKILMDNLTYSELISLSPKYKTFKKLEDMYDNFDSNNDILILEIGESTKRGYFNEFSFTQSANDPWNWKYTMSFVQLVDITKLMQQGAEGHPSKSTNGETPVDNS